MGVGIGLGLDVCVPSIRTSSPGPVGVTGGGCGGSSVNGPRLIQRARPREARPGAASTRGCPCATRGISCPLEGGNLTCAPLPPSPGQQHPRCTQWSVSDPSEAGPGPLRGQRKQPHLPRAFPSPPAPPQTLLGTPQAPRTRASQLRELSRHQNLNSATIPGSKKAFPPSCVEI